MIKITQLESILREVEDDVYGIRIGDTVKEEVEKCSMCGVNEVEEYGDICDDCLNDQKWELIVFSGKQQN